jgi:hypothetical protein
MYKTGAVNCGNSGVNNLYNCNTYLVIEALCGSIDNTGINTHTVSSCISTPTAASIAA